MNPEEDLSERAGRGVTRGADNVWEAAVREAARSRQRRGALIAAVVVPVGVAAAVVPFLLVGQRPTAVVPPVAEPTQSSTTSSQPSTRGAGEPTETGSTYPPRQLDVTYERCAIAAGFDPGFVQVLYDDTGGVESIKTGYEVPADVHRPCFQLIGGKDPHSSSYGDRVEPPSSTGDR